VRSTAEVQSVLDSFLRLNSKLSAQMGMPGADIDDLAGNFNSNGMMICALQWVLGADTIKISTPEVVSA
jgi:hypothetical protein